MNYIVSTFDCVVIDEKKFDLKTGVKYKLKPKQNDCGIIFSYENTIPFVLDLKHESENVLKVKVRTDNYYFLFSNCCSPLMHTKIKYKNKEVLISLSSKLQITIDGVSICENNVDNLKFSHYEICDELCLIYFSGKRDYLVAMKDEEVLFASYYDECNITENEKYFMCKLYDCLNHGKVFHIKNKEHSTYLVYLDDEEMNLKKEFVAQVFLDCLLAGNLKYCNAMLRESLKLKDEKQIKTFFPEFDFYYPVDDRTVILINKNTLAGIYEFEIENNLIVNISSS